MLKTTTIIAYEKTYTAAFKNCSRHNLVHNGSLKYFSWIKTGWNYYKSYFANIVNKIQLNTKVYKSDNDLFKKSQYKVFNFQIKGYHSPFW